MFLTDSAKKKKNARRYRTAVLLRQTELSGFVYNRQCKKKKKFAFSYRSAVLLRRTELSFIVSISAKKNLLAMATESGQLVFRGPTHLCRKPCLPCRKTCHTKWRPPPPKKKKSCIFHRRLSSLTFSKMPVDPAKQNHHKPLHELFNNC